MQKTDHIYYQDDFELKGFLAYKDSERDKMPAVIVIHDWSGVNEFARDNATHFANIGYVGFALDMYGRGKTGEDTAEKQKLMMPFLEDRSLIFARLQAALDTLKKLEFVDSKKICVVGFCFGGLCALDLARSGEDVTGIVSVHGLFVKPDGLYKDKSIKTKILALHGYDDPMVPPDAVNEFCEEMTKAKADWQLQIYGNTQHAFTNPHAHDHKIGTVYNAKNAQRAWITIDNFINEIFN